MTLDALRRQLLAARDDRAAIVGRLAAALPEGCSLAFLALNVPGPEKTSPRLERLARRAAAALPGARAGEGRDALGPWAAAACAGDGERVKRACVALEETLAAGRLLDVDVYDAGGRQVDRRSLGLPPRRCLACDRPAVDCIRAGRHSEGELAAAVGRLLHADERERLAAALVRGARTELELTPKPGLVDRLDNGSHPDLSFDLMARSIDLLPQYYADLIRLASAEDGPLDLAACVAAGRRAEARMLDAIGTNAHRGYIFLSGLVLLGWPDDQSAAPAPPGATAHDGPRVATAHDGLRVAAFRGAIADLARRIVAGRTYAASHGAAARARYGASGILGEALAGLPAIFEHGLPALGQGLARFGPTDAAHHWLMAALMGVVEDTTSLHRCGPAGLDRLKADGRLIREAMEAGAGHLGAIARLNDDYRAMGLTMGGVADGMAVTIAVQSFEEMEGPGSRGGAPAM